MFGIDWQVALSLAVVTLAAIYLVVRLFGIGIKKGKSCGSCHSCADNSADKPATGLKVRQIVQISKPPVPSEKVRD